MSRRTVRKPQAPETLFVVSPTLTAPAERHWFVPDESGSYCAACALPRGNARHVERAA